MDLCWKLSSPPLPVSALPSHVHVVHLPELGVAAVPLAVGVRVGDQVFSVHVAHRALAPPTEAGPRAAAGRCEEKREGPHVFVMCDI